MVRLNSLLLTALLLSLSAADVAANRLLMNADGTYETAYCWQYGGVVAPDYGAFAECYFAPHPIRTLVFDLVGLGFPEPFSMDAFIWQDESGKPGAVLWSRMNWNPGDPGIWPQVTRHTLAVDDDVTGGNGWWVGWWGNWPGTNCYAATVADLDGGAGCPLTKVAPGQGYPSGWQHVSIVWGPTAALGIGAEVDDATPVVTGSWGAIKRLYSARD